MKFTDRFKDQPAVKEVKVPDDFPSQRITKTYGMINQQLVYTIAEAAGIEQQYEKLTGTIAEGGPEVMKAAMALVDVEDSLMLRYRTIASFVAPHKVEEQAQQWRLETELLAKKHVRDAVRHH